MLLLLLYCWQKRGSGGAAGDSYDLLPRGSSNKLDPSRADWVLLFACWLLVTPPRVNPISRPNNNNRANFFLFFFFFRAGLWNVVLVSKDEDHTTHTQALN